MPSLCFCCLTKNEKVQIVMSNFGNLQRISQIEDSEYPQLICGRILPVTEVLQAPVSGKPCVYYEALAEQLVDKTDENGMIGIPDNNDPHKVWVPLCREIKSADFTLIDVDSPGLSVYVPGAHTKINVFATEDAIQHSAARSMRSKMVVRHDKLPTYTKDFLARHGIDLDDIGKKQVRYREANFEYGEQIAVLGLLRNVQDVNGNPVKFVKPVGRDSLTEEYFNKKGWDDWDRKAWREMTEEPCIVLTDMEKFFQGLKLPELPQKVTYAEIVEVMAERDREIEGAVQEQAPMDR